MTVVDVIVSVSHGVDNGPSAQEGHQLILDDDEQFLGLAMIYSGSPIKIDLPLQ
jgi:hypothetical protein